MNGKRSAGAVLLPIVACFSSLAQDGLEARNSGQTGADREKTATEPDLRIEPIASRVAKGKLYSLAPLADGRILAFDRLDRKPVYVMTKTRASTNVYTVTFGGSLVVKDGVVTELAGGTVQSTAFKVVFDRPQHLKVTWRVRLPAGVSSAKDDQSLSIIDLKDGRLMLLEGTRIYQLKVRRAPDGQYRSPAIGLLSVHRGALGPIRDVDYMLADDYAP